MRTLVLKHTLSVFITEILTSHVFSVVHSDKSRQWPKCVTEPDER